jgi:hypothetical protein
VKNVFTLSCKNRTVVARDLTVWATAIKGNPTDSTDIIIRDIPFPYCDGVDSLDFDFHGQLSRLILTVMVGCRGSRFRVGVDPGAWIAKCLRSSVLVVLLSSL